MSDKVEKFTFFKSFFEQMSLMSDEDIGKAVKALCGYAFDGVESDVSSLPATVGIFLLGAKPIIDRTADISQKRAQARSGDGDCRPKLDDGQNLSNANQTENKSVSNENKRLTKNNKSISNENKQQSNENGIGIGVRSKDKEYGVGVGIGNRSGDRETGSGSVDSARTRTHEPPDRPTVEDVEGYARRNGLEINAKAFVDHYNSVGWQVRGQPILDWRSRANLWAKQDAEKKANAPPKSAYMAAIENRVSDIDDWLERRSTDDGSG